MYFRIPSDELDTHGSVPHDWYIQGAKYVSSHEPARLVLESVSDSIILQARRASAVRRSLHTQVNIAMCLNRLTPSHISMVYRPETIESLFVAYRLTGDDRYRDYGWNIFQSIEKHCRVSTGGYASVINVDEVPVKLEDKMETFLLVSWVAVYKYRLFC